MKNGQPLHVSVTSNASIDNNMETNVDTNFDDMLITFIFIFFEVENI